VLVHQAEGAEATVHEFNEAINRRDLAALVALMDEDHRFVDSAGSAVEGRSACTEAWRSFFESFPDYRNRFDSVTDTGDEVVVEGRSECSVAELSGPARWRIRVRDGLVAEWRVEDV
jgi:ketosteroid isomerase-like protein